MKLSPLNNKERAEALRNVAFQLGMEFQEKDDFKLIALLRDFKLFRKGGRRTAFNLLTNTTGLMEEKITILDYRYSIRVNNSSRTFYQTVFFIQSKQLSMPQLLLKPEKFFHKIGAWLGMQDIDFEEYPDFSQRNLLQGEDEGRIRRTLGTLPEVIRFFTIEKNWCMESLGFYLILYKEHELIKPSSFKYLYETGMGLYEHLKTEMW